MKRNQLVSEECAIGIKLADVSLEGSLCVPPGAKGIVIFAHGSGSSRLSPRNRYVASFLQQNNVGTLLFDLLTTQEEWIDDRTGELRFNIDFLAQRLQAVTRWIAKYPKAEGFKLGYFGASTGAAAALVAAATLPKMIQAVVSRGGRPDLAAGALPNVKAPTLLVVGGEDDQVIELNRIALAKLQCEKALVIVRGATHLFEESGTLEEVARLAGDWFNRHFL